MSNYYSFNANNVFFYISFLSVVFQCNRVVGPFYVHIPVHSNITQRQLYQEMNAHLWQLVVIPFPHSKKANAEANKFQWVSIVHQRPRVIISYRPINYHRSELHPAYLNLLKPSKPKLVTIEIL